MRKHSSETNYQTAESDTASNEKEKGERWDIARKERDEGGSNIQRRNDDVFKPCFPRQAYSSSPRPPPTSLGTSLPSHPSSVLSTTRLPHPRS